MLGLLVLASLATIFLIQFFPKLRKNEAYNHPPGPKGLPIIGSVLHFGLTNTHFSQFYTLGKTYGPILRLRLINRSMVIIQSAALAKEVLHTNDMNICDRPVTAGTRKVTYNFLDLGLSPYSEYLKEMKKILSAHFLGFKNLETSSIINREEVSRLIQNVSDLSSASKLVNLNELVITYASSAASRLSFGKRYNEEEGAIYHRLLHEAEEMFTCFFYKDYIPTIGDLIDKVVGKNYRLERIFSELDSFFDRIISDHLGTNDIKLNSRREDTVDFLLRLMIKDTSLPFKLTIDHIKAIILNLFVAGANSTTSMIIWAIIELVKNPISMKKVQEELRNVTPKGGSISIEESDLATLAYFKAMVKETFRLHPPAPLLIPRKAIKQCVIGGYDILPKTTVYINAWAIGRDCKHWNDPEKFMPERFLTSKIKDDAKGLENFILIPFGRGRRMCPAYSIGVANLELALANLLYSFTWELPLGINKEDIDHTVFPGIVMHKKKSLYLVANKFNSVNYLGKV